MSKPLRAGVVGAGIMGLNHARVLKLLPDVELVGVVDPDAERRRIAAGHGPTFDTVDALIREGVEAAVVAAPNHLHREIGLALIEAGVHVLIEKPIAPTEADAKALIDGAAAADRRLMVGHIERFNPAVVAAKQAVKDDEIISIQITRVGPFPPRMSEVGIVIDLAVHDIDIIRYLTDDDIAEVQTLLARTRAEREDTALLQFRTTRDVIAQLNTNWLTPFKARRLQIATRSRFVDVDLMQRQVTEYSDYRMDGAYVTRPVMVGSVEPLRAELDAFVRSVRTGEKPAVTGEDGLENLRVALTCLAG